MVDGCGYLYFGEKKGQDTFTVKLATKPIKSKCMCIQACESSLLVYESRCKRSVSSADVVIEVTTDNPNMVRL